MRSASSRRGPLLGSPAPALAALLLVGAAGPAGGDTHYAPLENRPIKALGQEEIEGLRSGHGMGLALPAELNGYPGPRHVLDLADALHLDADQRRGVAHLFETMQEGAVALGAEVIAAEAALEALFAEAKATPEAIAAASREVALARGALRAHHLRYHLETRELLRPHQRARYQELRGYAKGPSSAGGHAPAQHRGHGTR